MKTEAVKYMLMAQDMERALSLHRTVFGLRLGFHSPWWSELHFGDAIVAFHGGHDGRPHATGLSYQVDDADEACRLVTAAGGMVLEPPVQRTGEPIRLARCRDGEGNEFAISQFVGGR